MRGHGVDFIRVNLGKKQAWKNSRSKHGYWANNSALKIVNFTAFFIKDLYCHSALHLRVYSHTSG